MIKRLFVEFNEKGEVICVCNADDKKSCEGLNKDDSNCGEYYVKFTEIGNVGQRKLTKSPKRDQSKRTLTGELSPGNLRKNTENKIKSMLQK